jgi:FxsC-like protein
VPIDTPSDPRESGPYFFLSYAHTPKLNLTGRHDPDRWIIRLFEDLCADILERIPDQTGPVGFIDQEIPLGAPWPQQLANALANCRVFVPLYSPRYFRSMQCGREWSAFSRRVAEHEARTKSRADAIVPALWTKVESATLPSVARHIQFDHQALGTEYSVDGFYRIMKLSRYRKAYREAVFELASRIVEVADRTKVSTTNPMDYDKVSSAFRHVDFDQRTDRPFKITMVVSNSANLSEHRKSTYYGAAELDWNPYYPESKSPLADYACRLVDGVGYQTTKGTFDDHVESLTDTPPTAPAMLVVDSWATLSAERRERLRLVDSVDQPWISVLVPWNRNDLETVTADKELRQNLHRALGQKLGGMPRIFGADAANISSLEAFRDVASEMAVLTGQQYLLHAEARPPEGPSPERPRLSHPDPNEDPVDPSRQG